MPAGSARWRGLPDEENAMTGIKVKLDHSVVHVSDRERSDAFYRDVLGAELVGVAKIRMYRFGDAQLNVHGPGLDAKPVARIPVAPGNSDICFEWPGPVEEAVAHLAKCGVPIDCGPQRGFGAKGLGDSVYFRDPDGTLLEFISYPSK
jgi:catechol 2,3-dioxygenase-like lactoylglutathione lyase family enzyme